MEKTFYKILEPYVRNFRDNNVQQYTASFADDYLKEEDTVGLSYGTTTECSVDTSSHRVLVVCLRKNQYLSTTLQTLKWAILEEWDSLPQSFINRLIKSFRTRCDSCAYLKNVESTSSFLCNLRNLPIKHFKYKTEAYGDETLSRAHVFEWYKRFSRGRDSGEDDECAERPRSAFTYQNIAKIGDMSRFPLTSRLHRKLSNDMFPPIMGSVHGNVADSNTPVAAS
ncbi:hypothetical protein TNCV_4298961 [Trichonephila clavipes]|nr:hypothetical protein TNCV_4298961 [Trichonephila clavipes]